MVLRQQAHQLLVSDNRLDMLDDSLLTIFPSRARARASSKALELT